MAAVNADSNLENLKAIHNNRCRKRMRKTAVNADSNLENLKAIHNHGKENIQICRAVNADSNLENLKAIHNLRLGKSFSVNSCTKSRFFHLPIG